MIISALRYKKRETILAYAINMYLAESEVIKSLASCFQGSTFHDAGIV